MGSKSDGEFNAMEYAHDSVTVWTDATGPEYGNHSRLNGLIYIDKHTQPDTGSGEWCLDSLMKDHYGTLTAPDIVRSVAALYQTGDAHVAVYDFDSASTLVSYGAYMHACAPSRSWCVDTTDNWLQSFRSITEWVW